MFTKMLVVIDVLRCRVRSCCSGLRDSACSLQVHLSIASKQESAETASPPRAAPHEQRQVQRRERLAVVEVDAEQVADEREPLVEHRPREVARRRRGGAIAGCASIAPSTSSRSPPRARSYSMSGASIRSLCRSSRWSSRSDVTSRMSGRSSARRSTARARRGGRAPAARSSASCTRAEQPVEVGGGRRRSRARADRRMSHHRRARERTTSRRDRE